MENLGGPSATGPVPMDTSNPLIPPQEIKPADASGLDALMGLKSAEKAAQQVTGKVDGAAVPVRAYLEQTVVPVLMAGLQQLVRERPEDPVDYLANYLLQNNKKQAGPSGSPHV